VANRHLSGKILNVFERILTKNDKESKRTASEQKFIEDSLKYLKKVRKSKKKSKTKVP
jgi:hypothetical protein